MKLSNRKSRGFTLVELLVVIGIIAVLIGILLPTLSRARVKSRTVACAAQLKDIGNLFRIYLNDHKNRLPHVNTLPSMQPPIAIHPVTGKSLPTIYETLDRDWKPKAIGEAQGSTGVWRCPADTIMQGNDTVGVPKGFTTYFDREGGSYQYNPFFDGFLAQQFDQLGGINQVLEKAISFYKERRGEGADRLRMMQDFEAFHGKPTEVGAMNFLYADFHVGPFEPKAR
ncbi:MAG: type II secretion system protein [Anaerolineae bacterium]|nr:type II secretion system protein [Phycisphaerae bacterium]